MDALCILIICSSEWCLLCNLLQLEEIELILAVLGTLMYILKILDCEYVCNFLLHLSCVFRLPENTAVCTVHASGSAISWTLSTVVVSVT